MVPSGKNRMILWMVVAATGKAAEGAVSEGGDSAKGMDSTAIIITILKFYAIITGIVFLMMTCASIPFLCEYCWFREEAAEEGNGESASDTPNKMHCLEVERIVCATFCWPVLALVALGMMLFEAGTCLTSGLARPRTEVVETSKNDPGVDDTGHLSIVIVDGHD